MANAQARVPGVEARAGKFPGPSLIPALHAIQERLGWLPREELEALSRDVRRPLYEIEGLISFYPHFRTEPPKKVTLHVCHDLSCWLQGADQRIAALQPARQVVADVQFDPGGRLGAEVRVERDQPFDLIEGPPHVPGQRHQFLAWQPAEPLLDGVQRRDQAGPGELPGPGLDAGDPRGDVRHERLRCVPRRT